MIRKSLILSVLISTWMVGASQEENQVTFRDCEICPMMTTIPAGSVFIGSHGEEIGRKKGERPRTSVTIDYNYAMSRTEVTLEQYRHFVAETDHQSEDAVYKEKTLIGCNYYDGKSYGYIASHTWQNPGYPQREDAPVVCVSWSDATAYADWLSSKTGRKYKIPSTVEFEYAARGGAATPWYWGTDLTMAFEYANVGQGKTCILQSPGGMYLELFEI